jgi:membrane protein implicated in regulation of membrane protease activity
MNLTFAPKIEIFPYVGIGEVEKAITPSQRGRVRFMATTWFAQFYQPNALCKASPGDRVRVIGREGLTLLVISVGRL